MAKASKNIAATFENPYRVGGGYWASVQALIALGAEQLHSFEKIVPAVVKVMTDAGTFKAFKAKKSDSENAYDLEKRILCNVMVCNRSDYGAPLRNVGYEVVWNGRAKTVGLFKLGKARPATVAVGKASTAKPTAKKSPAVKPAAKKGKVAKSEATVCGRCEQPLKMFKDKGETEAKPTCPDCGWRPGDRKGVVSPKQIALAASATKAK